MSCPDIRQNSGAMLPAFMEHRWGQRLPCRAQVRLSAGAGVGGAGRIRDISSSGAFIETAAVLQVNMPVSLVVLGNESAGRPVEIEAIVVRTEPDGVGIEWCDTASGAICSRIGCTTRCAAP